MPARIAFMSSARCVPKLYAASAQTIFESHGGNTGNVAFVNAIASHLKGEVTSVGWGASSSQIRDAGDVLIIACANQLGPHTDLGGVARNIEGAGVPVVALGLGAQATSSADQVTLSDGTRRWLDLISRQTPSSSPNIGVRGKFTALQMERWGVGDSATIIGCPSNFTNLSFDYVKHLERRQKQEIRCIAGAIGIPFDKKLEVIERMIIRLVDDTGGICIVQHGLSMIQLACAEFGAVDESAFELTRSYFKPDLSADEFRRWCRRRLAVFGDADNWMNWLRHYDFVVGPRFHGVMLALQAGVPAGCVAHDARTVELCETMGVPVRSWDTIRTERELSLDCLHELFPFDASLYAQKRQRLMRNYVELLRGAEVSFDERLH